MAEPPPATGIDYLRLVEARADAELGQRTSYAGIAGTDTQLTLPGADWPRPAGPPGGAGSGGDEDKVAR